MKNRSQSFTSISFDSNRPAGPSYHFRQENLKSERDSNAVADLAAERAGKDLLKLCQEIAGVLIRRYLVSDSATEVRAEMAAGLKKRLSCNDRQAQALINLALEIIHVKSYGKYRCSPERLEKLISLAGGIAQ